MKIKFLLVLAVVFGLGVWLSFSNISYAISSGGLGIYPNQSEWNLKDDSSKSWFIYTLDPGEIKQSKVDIKNESDQSILLTIYPVDAVTTKDGSFAPQSEDSIKKNVGSWITLPITELSLKPHEIKTVDYTITVPQNVDIGDHMGAIIIQAKNTDKTKTGTSMQVINRLGARIYITIPGERIEKLAIESFNSNTENGKIIFQLTLVNEGNVRIAPKGKIEIKDESGTVVDTIDLAQREIFPRDKIVLPTKWDKTLEGKFTVLATVDYGGQKLTKELILNNERKVLETKNTNTVLAIGIILGVILIILLTVFLIRKWFLQK